MKYTYTEIKDFVEEHGGFLAPTTFGRVDHVWGITGERKSLCQTTRTGPSDRGMEQRICLMCSRKSTEMMDRAN